MHNNIVKETCEELGIKYKELANIMGVHEATPAQWNSKGNIPETAINFMKLLVEHNKTQTELSRLKNALRVLKDTDLS